MEGLDWSRIITIAVGLVALLIGWAIGFFDSNNRAEKKIRAAEERAEIAIRQAKGEAERAAARVAQAEEKAAASASAPGPVSALPGKTLLRLWLDDRERSNLDLDGQPVDTAPISDYNRRRLIALVTVMRPWIEGKPAASEPMPAPAAPMPVSTPVSASRPPSTTPVEMPSLSKSLAASVSNMLTVKKEEKPTKPMSMVEQIDEILQARIAGGPLMGREIKLIESPEGGVIVAVGRQRFAGVGEVTDLQIQSEIRAAIAEWEKKYTPGL